MENCQFLMKLDIQLCPMTWWLYSKVWAQAMKERVHKKRLACLEQFYSAPNWEQSKCLPTRVNKQACTIYFHSVRKRNRWLDTCNMNFKTLCWKKADAKHVYTVWFHIHEAQEQVQVIHGAGSHQAVASGVKYSARGQEGTAGGMEMFCLHLSGLIKLPT